MIFTPMLTWSPSLALVYFLHHTVICMSTSTTHARLCKLIPIFSRIRTVTGVQSYRYDARPALVARRFAHQNAPRSESHKPKVADPPRRRTTLQLRGIAPDIKPRKIPEIFSRFGDIKDCVMRASSSCILRTTQRDPAS